MAARAVVEVVGPVAAHELGHLCAVERAETDLVGGRQLGSLGRPRAHDHEDRDRPAQDVAEPVGERLAGQVRVVDDEDRPAGAGDPTEDVGHRGEERGGAEGRVDPARLTGGRGRQAEQGSEGAELGAEEGVHVGRPAQVVGDRREYDVERRGPVERPAGPGQHQVAADPPRPGPRIEQGRLADPGVADDLRDPGAAVVDGP